MIVVRIWEGLGNQLFQYAYARSLQLRNGGDVRLCALHGEGNRTYRQYELDKFKITLARDKNIEKIASYIDKNIIVKRLLKQITEKVSFLNYIHEKNVKYDEKQKYLIGNYYVSGWFQNEEYFKEYASVIRKEIQLKKKIKISKQLRHILKNCNTVSVHIRRGDYKRYNNVLNMEYYQKAFALINSCVEDVYFVVFSDDLEWVKKNIDFGERVYFVNEDKRLKDYEELVIMSKCKHNIIANSTFSWWGAWLNTYTQKIVIGPKQWFPRDNSNIMPETWIKL